MRAAAIEPASDGPAAVVLESTAPLPHPVVGVLDGPPRIYFDFAGFRPGPSLAASADDRIVRGVRIALHSAEPLLTRVVIDLHGPTRYRMDTRAAASGRLVILVGAVAPIARASRDALPTTSGTRAQGLAAVLTQLDALTPLLTAIDSRGETSTVSLQGAAAQIDSAADALRTLQPAPALRPARDRLAQACALARQAVSARLEAAASGNAALNWNAASAAAGALLLLDAARGDLGSRVPPVR